MTQIALCVKRPPDTPFHRLYKCSACQTDREEIAPPEFLERALEAGSGSLLYVRGIIQHPSKIVPPPKDIDCSVYLVGGDLVVDEFRRMSGDLYVDGACFPGLVSALPELAGQSSREALKDPPRFCPALSGPLFPKPPKWPNGSPGRWPIKWLSGKP